MCVSQAFEIPKTVVLSHALAAKILREEFSDQNAKIGITINSNWNAAWRADNKDDVAAAERKMISELGFWAGRVCNGLLEMPL